MAYDDLLGADSGQKVAHRDRQTFCYERVVDAIGLPALGDEPSCLQHRQVPRDRGPADLEPGDDLAGSQLTLPQVLEDLTTSGIGERPEDARLFISHVHYLATELDSLQVLLNLGRSALTPPGTFWRWRGRRAGAGTPVAHDRRVAPGSGPRRSVARSPSLNLRSAEFISGVASALAKGGNTSEFYMSDDTTGLAFVEEATASETIGTTTSEGILETSSNSMPDFGRVTLTVDAD